MKKTKDEKRSEIDKKNLPEIKTKTNTMRVYEKMLFSTQKVTIWSF